MIRKFCFVAGDLKTGTTHNHPMGNGEIEHYTLTSLKHKVNTERRAEYRDHSCIYICWIPRMMFEHEADRPSVQHHPRDPASVNSMK